jgi:soluble lytic murein transglycosylase-like protein
MTNRWIHPAVRIRSNPVPDTAGNLRVTAGALGAVLVAVLLVSGATAPLDARPTQLASALPSISADRQPVVAQAGHRVAQADPRIDTLAGIVARKYRVSEEATREFVRTAYREGARYGIDPLLVVSVMAVESRFNPVAQSDGGAMGLMQVIPRFHAEKFDAEERSSVLDPRINIQVGVRILKEYIGRGGNELAGLQLYNGAPDDASFAYANRVLGERQSLQDAIRRERGRSRA